MNDLPRRRLMTAIPEQMREMIEARSQMGADPWLQVGLTMKRVKMGVVVGALGPGRPSVLAASIGMSSASATGVLDRLVEQGYVERQVDAADRRALLIQLPPAGTRTVSELYMS